MKSKRIEITIIAILLVLQSALFIVCGMNKAYLHMDEAHSFGIASYNKTEIQENEDFYNNWHNSEYFEDYLAGNNDDTSYSTVYKNAVHHNTPPVYYFLLRFVMGFFGDGFSFWSGISLNIILYAGITVLSYVILKRMFKGQKYATEKSAVVAFLASVTLASLSAVIYIMPYALSSLNILLAIYLHIKLAEEEKSRVKWYILIGIATVIGLLSNYDYLFFVVMLFVRQLYRYLRTASFKSFWAYLLTVAVSVLSALAAFPSGLTHVITGYWIKDLLVNIDNTAQTLQNFTSFAYTLNVYGFNAFLIVIGVFAAFVAVYRKNHRDKARETVMPDEATKDILKSVYMPTFFYFIIVSVVSPWIELRYILPVCIPLFMLLVYYFQRLLASVFGETRGNVLVCTALVLMSTVMPYYEKLSPEVQFEDREEIVATIGENKALPTVYFYNSSSNRFLDDILLFTEIENSYIARDTELSAENIKSITEGRDISEGMLVFINFGNSSEDYDKMLSLLPEATGLSGVEWIYRLNDCDVYIVK